MLPPSSGSKKKPSKKSESRALLLNVFMIVSCLAYSSTLKMETRPSSERLVDFSGVLGVVFQNIELSYYLVHKIPSINPTFSQFSPIHTFTSYSLKTDFNTVGNANVKLNVILHPALDGRHIYYFHVAIAPSSEK
jgi:hypothetical protein